METCYVSMFLACDVTMFMTGVCQLREFSLGGSFQLIAVSPLRIFKLYRYSTELLFEQVIPLDMDGGSLYKCVGI